jgi:DNA-binding NarL/FixJ family response regulator
MSTPDNRIKVLIADDHPIFRQGLKKVLEEDGKYSIISETSNGTETLEKIRELKPDAALLDIDMPGLNGIEILKSIQIEKIPVKSIILTMYKDEEYFNQAMEYGVFGYLLKDSVVIELIECLDAVESGKHYISPKISDYLLQRSEKQKVLTNAIPQLQLLTKTEREVLRHLSENKTSRKIAEEMFISERTVENHRANICSKLGLKGYNALLLFAVKYKSVL